MARRPLAPEEAALWAKVIESVTPLAGRAKPRSDPKEPSVSSEVEGLGKPQVSLVVRPSASLGTNGAGAAKTVGVAKAVPKVPANTLDGSWDRRLTRGTISPDIAIDLHGHTLATAYDTLDQGLAHAIGAGMRVVLLVTGKPRPERGGRGAIRAAVGDWLAASRHASRIAAVRGAHPRHGGQGALYIILRRDRER